MRVLLVVIVSLLLAVPALAQGGGEVRKYFRDWLAACRADGYCSATAYQNPDPGDGSVADYILRVGRHAEQSYWELSFTTVATMADEWAEFIVAVDGESETFSLRSEIGAYGAVNDFFLLGGRAQRVMDLMTPGREISFAFTDTGAASQEATFSLGGLTAALLWIDEQQGRVGSERVAAVAPYGLAPAGQEQEVTPQFPLALLDRHNADPECRPFEELANGRDFATDQLDESSVLYVVPCWSAAYNFGWKVYVQTNDELFLQYFASYGGGDLGWMGTPYLVNFAYDPATKTLSDFNKSRGVGDCGSSGTWRWNGYVFRLEEMRARECDDGPIDENAEIEYPLVYSAPPMQNVTQ